MAIFPKARYSKSLYGPYQKINYIYSKKKKEYRQIQNYFQKVTLYLKVICACIFAFFNVFRNKYRIQTPGALNEIQNLWFSVNIKTILKTYSFDCTQPLAFDVWPRTSNKRDKDTVYLGKTFNCLRDFAGSCVGKPILQALHLNVSIILGSWGCFR